MDVSFLDKYSHVGKVHRIFQKKYSFMGDVILKRYCDFGDLWSSKFNYTLSTLLNDESSLEKAVKGYVEFALDAIRLQAKFEKTLKYENKTYEETSKEVYHNKDYMLNLYLPGLLLSHYLWPHHYRQNDFFINSFLQEMYNKKASRFIDVGVGSGYYSRLILDKIANISGQGYDISENSKEYTLNQISSFGFSDRYNLEIRDVLQNTPENSTDWLVNVEVLEHLENPQDFLFALRKILRPNGKAFITAALNAPNADHIYLYKTPLEVIKQLELADFTVEQTFTARAHHPRLKGTPVPEIAAFIVQ